MTAYIKHESDLPQPDDYDPLMHWRPAPRDCSNCRHKDVLSMDQPCTDCRYQYSKWEWSNGDQAKNEIAVWTELAAVLKDLIEKLDRFVEKYKNQ